MPRFNPPKRRSTPAGEHRPVLLDEVVAALEPHPGDVAVDCTVGWAGHARELLRHIGPTGKLIGFDFDAENLSRAREQLDPVSLNFELHHGNFAGLAAVLAGEQVDLLLADLGMSSMQVDDPARGFSYVREGPLDMRMDRSRGRTAAQLLQEITEDALRSALTELGDEPYAERVAAAVVAARGTVPLETTTQLAEVIRAAVPGESGKEWRLLPTAKTWKTHPAARTFQVLRILVNRELANLEQLLRVLPSVLKPGGRAALISFHSGEDRLVKAAFRAGLRTGIYSAAADDPVRATFDERNANPRSRSAKLRWARRTLE